MVETRRVAPGVQQYARGSTPGERLASVQRAIDAAERRNDAELVRQLRRALSDEVWRDAYLDRPRDSAASSESPAGRFEAQRSKPAGMFEAPRRSQQVSTENTGNFEKNRRRAVGRAAVKRRSREQ